MSLKQFIIMISIALMMALSTGMNKGGIIKDGGYNDTIDETVYTIESGYGENG